MQDLSTLSNDELFKLCKSSGITAGPITQTTRSVYEKKLLRCLNEMTTTTPDSPKSVEVPSVESLNPVVILKANLEQIGDVSSGVVAPKFVKPSIPINPNAGKTIQQQTPEQEIVYIEKPSRRSMVKRSSEERTFEISQDKRDIQPTIIQTATRTYKEEIFNGMSERNSPLRQKKVESPVRKTAMPEFKLLKPQQLQQPQEEVRFESAASFTGPNIRKRTATVDRQSVLSDRSNLPAEETKIAEKKSSGFFSLKKILFVLAMTVIVYFLMMHLQSNPENPIESE